jgi:hypothetical protein
VVQTLAIKMTASGKKNSTQSAPKKAEIAEGTQAEARGPPSARGSGRCTAEKPAGGGDESRACKQAGGSAIYHNIKSARYGPFSHGRGSVGYSETLNFFMNNPG